MRGSGTTRSGQVKAPPKGRGWRGKKLRRRRTRGNATTSRGRQEAAVGLSAQARDTAQLGATNARGVGREQRGNLRGGCMSKLCVE